MARVVIAGAGPAGAVLAYLLARRGVEVVLLERHTDFAREFRGEVLQPGGLEPFRQMGLWKQLEAVPHTTLGALELYLNGRRVARAAFDPEAFGDYQPRWLSQPALLEMLVQEAAQHPSFTLERGANVRSLVEQDGRVVGVRLVGDREVRGDLVVGADGRSSAVRRRARLPQQADRAPMDVVWCKLPLPEFLAGDPHARFYAGAGHLAVAAPVYDDALQLAWIIEKGSYGELRERGVPEYLEEMARHVSPDLAAHVHRHRDDGVSPFLLSVVADRVTEWTRPGLLVIGDAAHTMSPVGAQGINIAIRDAVVAANHLVPTFREGPDPAAIDRASRAIQDERLREVSLIQRIQAQPPRVVLRNTWWSRLALRAAMPLLAAAVPLARNGPLFRRFAFGVTDVRLQV